MRFFACLSVVALSLAACAAPDVAVERRAIPSAALPAMKAFGPTRVPPPRRSNADIARDFLDLSFALESGRALPVFTRFEGPVTLRLVGPAPARLEVDLAALLGRLRREAGITITQVGATRPAGITVEIVPGGALERAVPEAACFVVPRVSGWDEFRRIGRSPATDWTTLRVRDRLAIFLPADTAPQEMRDCLHEELAQALGPLNDLYRLDDSVFNDDNFHAILTGFDMLVLRATYAPELRSGLTRSQVAALLPVMLDRLNPAGRSSPAVRRSPTDTGWKAAIERALGPARGLRARRSAARRAVAMADAAGWRDNRTGFALFAFGRLSLATDPEAALGAFERAARIFADRPETRIHAAHVAMQIAAMALGTDRPRHAAAIVDTATEAAAEAENAGLLASLLLVKSEALTAIGRTAEARTLRNEALAWARYGFGRDDEVRALADDIAAIRPHSREETPS